MKVLRCVSLSHLIPRVNRPQVSTTPASLSISHGWTSSFLLFFCHSKAAGQIKCFIQSQRNSLLSLCGTQAECVSIRRSIWRQAVSELQIGAGKAHIRNPDIGQYAYTTLTDCLPGFLFIISDFRFWCSPRNNYQLCSSITIRHPSCVLPMRSTGRV